MGLKKQIKILKSKKKVTGLLLFNKGLIMNNFYKILC